MFASRPRAVSVDADGYIVGVDGITRALLRVPGLWTCSRIGSVFGKKYIPARSNSDVKIVDLLRLHYTYLARASHFYRSSLSLMCA